MHPAAQWRAAGVAERLPGLAREASGSRMKSREVRIWAVKVNKLSDGRKSYTARWSVAGHPHSKTFGKRALAEHHRSDLMQAANRGEEFDTERPGLPDSMMPAKEVVTWLELVRRYVDMK